ncbi:peptidoglycan DD-metalloendopeptidase family protein [Arcanobacterium phocisimile]|uniref:Peptidoglycan DD-metalloendopeptidase family protein n=1 Tax=Arcanobacterium phocisimile TaxID=1302235 RepID=A0ABX7IEX1_9ACTO|nr:peptidoglycan DD-metalloendopeptidase family protein [Arcanobacterium phocisimile]QRV01678.1 peptidoglycan DD-metalloendopeptidase family protein [Arcanobacterium phocisimile]
MSLRRRSIAGVCALMVVVGGLTLPASADEREDLVNQQEQNAQREREIKSTLEGLDVNLQDAFLELEKTRSQIPRAEADLATAQNELAIAERQAQANAALLFSAKEELASISGELSTSSAAALQTKRKLAEIARATYRGETMPNAIDLVLGSASAKEFTDAYRVNAALTRTQSAAFTELSQSVARSKNRQSRQEAVEDRVEELKAESDALVVARDNARDVAQTHKDTLLELESSITAQTQSLEQRKAEFEASLVEVEKSQQAASARIAAIDEENRRREAERLAALNAAQQAAAAAQRASAAGGWLNPPIPGPLVVTSPFGMRVYPLGNYRRMHQGVDLQSACGDPQYAAADGVVASTEFDVGGGNIVYVNHGIHNGSSYVTAHMHLSAIKVAPGQRVSQGDLIGLSGATGRVTGCHVHFEVWQNGTAINPMGLPGF